MPATVGRRMDRLVQTDSPVRGIYRRNGVRVGIIAAAFVTAWYAIGAFGRPYNFFDMKIYHGAAGWWASGHDLYAYAAPDTGLGFTYPPFAGLLMLPLSWIPFGGAAWVNVVASMLALAVVMWALMGPIAFA